MYLTAFAAAAAAFLITALGGKPLIHLLESHHLTAFLMREKDGVKTPDKKPVPEMGGLLYLCGLLGGGIIGSVLLLITGGGEAFSASVSFGKLGAVLICTLLMGLLGLLDDWRRARSLPPMSPAVRLLLVSGIALSFLFGIWASGDRSTILLLPFGSQLDLGIGYPVLLFLMLIGSVYGAGQMSASSGQLLSVSLISSLGCGGIFAVFAIRGICEISFASAGAMLGLTLFSFPPEKLREGNGCRKAGGVFPMAAGIAGGAPLFVLFMGLPFIFEGIYVMIKLCVNIGGKELPAENFGATLREKGWRGQAVCGLYAFSALAGGIAAVSAAVLYL